MARSGTALLFPHRPNPDGGIDLICSTCFRIVASSTDESELSTLEEAHACLGFGLGPLLYPIEAERHGRLSAKSEGKK